MEKISKKSIAPCGMNCGICLHYLRDNNKCPGCASGRKVNQVCIKCGIKQCKERKGEYCFDCDKFPCARLQRMDKRYREKYGMSEIKNLEYIRDNGIESFIKQERQKWQSAQGTFCVHDQNCYQ